VRADLRQRLDRGFEAIECVMLSGCDHFKRPCHIHSLKLRMKPYIILSRFGSFAALSTGFRASRDHAGKCYFSIGGGYGNAKAADRVFK
jgi:hypothetical protein